MSGHRCQASLGRGGRRAEGAGHRGPGTRPGGPGTRRGALSPGVGGRRLSSGGCSWEQGSQHGSLSITIQMIFTKNEKAKKSVQITNFLIMHFFG